MYKQIKMKFGYLMKKILLMDNFYLFFFLFVFLIFIAIYLNYEIIIIYLKDYY